MAELIRISGHKDASIDTESIQAQVGLDERLWVSSTQYVVADTNNGSEDNLTALNSYTYEGTATSTLGIVGIQVSLKTDQNCIVYVEQSPDSTNWDIADSFTYYHSLGGQSWTVQAVNSYVRVRVVGTTETTYFRLQTALCPIVEALPRSLDDDGRLKVTAHLSDDYGFNVEATPIGELRTADVVKLVGANFTGTTVDSNFWTVTNANDGTTTQGNSNLLLQTNTTSANGSTKVNSVRVGRYSAGSAMRFRTVVQLSAVAANNKRRWGIAFGTTMPTITDGAYFELDGSTFSIVTLKGSSETRVSSGDFNGMLGSEFTAGTGVRTYEIYWTNSKVWFVVNDKILHTFSATSATWADTVSHYIFLDNVNSNNLQTNNILYCRVASISRLGPLLNQPMVKYQAGTTAGIILKYGAGNLHGIIISGVVNNAVVTLYDNTAASGTVIWSSGTMAANTTPFDLDFKGIPFSLGLTLVIGTANCNATIMYE